MTGVTQKIADQPSIGDIVAKYIELRDRQAVIAERHKEELRPLSEGMAAIEKYMLDYMDKAGIDSVKTPAGTPYKNISRSVKMADPVKFKEYVFADAIKSISGILGPDYENLVKTTLLDDIRWDMIDFRCGKKGIVELIENDDTIKPADLGVEFSQFTTVNIRRN